MSHIDGMGEKPVTKQFASHGPIFAKQWWKDSPEGKVPKASSGRTTKVIFSLPSVYMYFLAFLQYILCNFLWDLTFISFLIWLLKIRHFTISIYIVSLCWLTGSLYLSEIPTSTPALSPVPTRLTRRHCPALVVRPRADVQGSVTEFPFPGSQLACGFYVQGYLFSNQRHWIGTSGGKLVALGSFETSQVGGFVPKDLGGQALWTVLLASFTDG